MTRFHIGQHPSCSKAQSDCTLENFIEQLRASVTPAEAIAVLQQALTQELDRVVHSRIRMTLAR